MTIPHTFAVTPPRRRKVVPLYWSEMTIDNWSSQNGSPTLYAPPRWRARESGPWGGERRASRIAVDRLRRVGYEAAISSKQSSVQPSSAACRTCGNRHYPPSWVEALNSLDQVVIGSATPVGASQWGLCGTGSRALRSAPGDTPEPPAASPRSRTGPALWSVPVGAAGGRTRPPPELSDSISPHCLLPELKAVA
jgi:hypothetical protein